MIGSLVAIQEALGRPLCPLVIGGTQYLEVFARHFDRATFIDSTPFVKATRRQKLTSFNRRPRWEDSFTLVGQGVDDILAMNLKHYSDWLEQEWHRNKHGESMPTEVGNQI